jgi:hypothetical protein
MISLRARRSAEAGNHPTNVLALTIAASLDDIKDEVPI